MLQVFQIKWSNWLEGGESSEGAQSTQSSGSSSIRHRSEDELKIIRLKEAIRQQDEYYSACLAYQKMLFQVSWVILLQL
jgi:hypothetical protein